VLNISLGNPAHGRRHSIILPPFRNPVIIELKRKQRSVSTSTKPYNIQLLITKNNILIQVLVSV